MPIDLPPDLTSVDFYTLRPAAVISKSRPCGEACQPLDHHGHHPDHPEPEGPSGSTSASTSTASLSLGGLPTTLNVPNGSLMPFRVTNGSDPWQPVRYGFIPIPGPRSRTSTVPLAAIGGGSLQVTYVLPTAGALQGTVQSS
jgi:hypothetical protein